MLLVGVFRGVRKTLTPPLIFICTWMDALKHFASTVFAVNHLTRVCCRKNQQVWSLGLFKKKIKIIVIIWKIILSPQTSGHISIVWFSFLYLFGDGLTPVNALHWFSASFCNSLKGSRANQVSSWKATPGPHEPGLLVHIRIAGRTNSVRWKLTSVTKSSSDAFRGFSGWKHIYWIVFIYHKRCNMFVILLVQSRE